MILCHIKLNFEQNPDKWKIISTQDRTEQAQDLEAQEDEEQGDILNERENDKEHHTYVHCTKSYNKIINIYTSTKHSRECMQNVLCKYTR